MLTLLIDLILAYLFVGAGVFYWIVRRTVIEETLLNGTEFEDAQKFALLWPLWLLRQVWPPPL
jgi:hypothetical protein